MSVTITYDGAPRTTEVDECMYCEGTGNDPSTGEACTGCQGNGTVEYESAELGHEVNWANVHAQNFFRVLHVPGGLYDDVPAEALPAIIRRVILALNLPDNNLVTEDEHIEGGHAGVQVVEGEDGVPTIQSMGAEVTIVGLNQDKVDRRLRDFLSVLKHAQAAGVGLRRH